MPDVDLQEFGRLQAEVSALRRDMDRMAHVLDDMNQTLTEVQRELSEARGGWKTMMLLGGASATLGALVVKAVTFFSQR
jgi:prefoldin subunit 5